MGIVTTAKGKLYVRHMEGGRIRDNMSADEIAALVRHGYACGRKDGKPRRGGRPTNEQRALKALLADSELLRHVLEGTPLVPLGSQPPVAPSTLDPDDPRSWPPITPDEAIRDLIAGMPVGSTRDGYASALNIQAEALGRDSWELWMGWWQWLFTEYPNANTRQNHISAANALIKHGLKNTVRRFIPKFKPAKDRPRLTKKAKRKAKRIKKPPVPYTLGEMAGLTNTSYLLKGADHYSTLAEHICALAAPHIGDVLVMLGGWSHEGPAGEMGCEHCDGRGNVLGKSGRAPDCEHCQDWGFEWDGPCGASWWRGYRVKTGERIDTPIAPSLANMLRPLACGRGLEYRGKPGRGTSGKLPKSTMQFRTAHQDVERRAGVQRVKGQSWKRFRTGFQRVLENDLRIPKPVRQRLIAHQVGDEAAIGAYAAVLDQELVDAVLEYEKLFLAAEPERTAGSGAA